MIRIELRRLQDGQIMVVLTVGHHTVLVRTVWVTDSAPVTLEVADE